MKDEFNRYGRRLTNDEYMEKIVDLYSPKDHVSDEATTQKKELNLQIDHRLGVEFPQDKREALWNEVKAARKAIVSEGLKGVVKGLLKGNTDIMDNFSTAAVNNVALRAARVLDEEDMLHFLGPKSERVLPRYRP